MEKYRIKQVGDNFYPQYKKIFGWGYYQGKPYLDYSITYFLSLEKTIFYENLYFESFDKANNFLNEIKKENTVVYHNIKNK